MAFRIDYNDIAQEIRGKCEALVSEEVPGFVFWDGPLNSDYRSLSHTDLLLMQEFLRSQYEIEDWDIADEEEFDDREEMLYYASTWWKLSMGLRSYCVFYHVDDPDFVPSTPEMSEASTIDYENS